MRYFVLCSIIAAAVIINWANSKRIEQEQKIEYPTEVHLLNDNELFKLKERHANTPALHRASIDTAIAIKYVQEAGVGARDKVEATLTLKKAIMCLSELTTIPKKETKFIYQVMLSTEDDTDQFIAGVVGSVLERQDVGSEYTCPIFTKKAEGD
ncbi:hypothetical protein [Vibrio owensii]|uniref:hypothetical protein n=1 Tax=Vibrio owensii TaxID=696485 RepID=UPI0018F131E2|nr:hypothetical protein [Vibrio owensii]